MPTHFNKKLYEKAVKLIYEANDLHAVAMDLNNITYFLSLNPTFEVKLKAESFNIELRQKYPTIDKMLNIANSITISNTTPTDYRPCAMEYLKQDYYGIICDTLLKKRIISSIEEFIERRD